MTIRVAINGYGRIGRNILRAHYEQRKHDIAIVAINDLASAEASVHLTRYDTVHGRFPVRVDLDGNVMTVGGDYIKVFAQPDPSRIPWSDFGIDVVMECTGRFTTKAKASAHLKGGARKVVISALGDEAVDATVVYGVNHRTLKPWHTVISNASCTTNCLAPVAQPLDRSIGIVSGIVTSVQGYTSDQTLTDVHDDDLRRARSATMSMIPVKTGAPAAIGRILPELAGKLEGNGIRVPTSNVALLELSFVAARDTTVEEINAVMKEASETGPLAGILFYSLAPLVSVDFNHDPASATFDATLTKVAGRLVKVSAWYDNEWGFANRMLDTTTALMEAGRWKAGHSYLAALLESNEVRLPASKPRTEALAND
jgi:glyceraldehyde 3-phosphate dehydrogenase